MKTAMQELISELNLTQIADREKLIMVKYIIEQCLKKEKEQIMDAYWQGKEDAINTNITLGEQSEDYYNQTYNQNK